MAVLCISITYLKTEISAEYEFTYLSDLTTEIAAQDYYTNHKDLITEIAVTVPFLDLYTEISAGFPPDSVGPHILPETYPLDGEGGIGISGPVFIVVEDLISGVDLSSLELTVNSIVYTREDSEVSCLPMNVPHRYAIRYIPSVPWVLGSSVNVTIYIKDRAGNQGMVDLAV